MAKKHKAHDHEEHIDETWLIPYADLLTLLLALFIVLFASSSVDAKKFDQLSQSLSAALDGGISFFESQSPVDLDGTTANKKNDGSSEDEFDNLGQRIEEIQNRDQKDQDQDQNQENEQAQFQKETEDLKKLQEKLNEYIQENGLSTQLETNLNQSQLMITIRDNALFPSGSAAVKPEAQVLAVAIADMLKDYPQFQIIVAGHTDDRPINTSQFESNWDLSAERALNFMKILLDNENVEPKRFSTIGYGEYRPIETNDTAAGRAQNRRVEVSVLRNFLESPVE
jgi:chemotaxis protein MotB